MSDSDDPRYTPAEVDPNGGQQNPYGSPGAYTPPPPPPPTGGGGGGGEYTAPAPSATGGSSSSAGTDTVASRQQFIRKGLDDVKAMVKGADPSHVRTVAQNWSELHDDLVGKEGDGGLKKKFDDAVKKVLETWHGKSAEKFAKEAQKISKRFADASYKPAAVSSILEQTADCIQDVMGFVDAVKEPSAWDRAWDRGKDMVTSGPQGAASVLNPIFAGYNLAAGTGRDDSGLERDLANPHITIGQAVNNNAGSLSIDRERQLEAAHYVEQLATFYRSAKVEIDKVSDGVVGPDRPQIPGGGGGGGGGLPSISPFKPGGTGPGAGPGAELPTADVPGYEGLDPGAVPGTGEYEGISGPKPGSAVGTGLEGIGTGTGGGSGGGSNLGNLSGSGPGTGGGTGGGVGPNSGLPGGLPGAGGGGGGGAGRMGGMPGMGGAAGAGAGGKSGSGRGGLARKSGGTVGRPSRAGTAAQGGSGLHRSRGGAQAGKGAGGGRMGMMGAPGAGGAGANSKNRSQRPDYLLEDEESWTPQKNVAPRVIE